MKKFLAIDSTPLADGAIDPSTNTDGAGHVDAADEWALPDNSA